MKIGGSWHDLKSKNIKINNMYRTHTCGELNISNVGQQVTLCGWMQRSRDLGGLTFIDLRDRYGITQLAFNMELNAPLCEQARKLGCEYVVQAKGVVIERSNKNTKMPTGEIEIDVKEIVVLNAAKTPPFTIEDNSDGGDDIRMKYRYLDLRRNPVRRNLELRHKMAMLTRNYLSNLNFLEIETPYLIKSTPEGARDFVVPSRMNPGEFYALPQSPQQQKQLLMVAGFDRYFQIVRCFRDEDLRADRQPEFTQIDCEMSFVEREDILRTFEGMAKRLFKNILHIEFNDQFPRISYADAMEYYGSDKPDIRFGMKLQTITSKVQRHGFSVFDAAEYVGAIVVPGCADYSRKQLDELTEWVKRPQVGAKGLVYIKEGKEGIKSSVDKFFTVEELSGLLKDLSAEKGDLVLILSGGAKKMRTALGTLRIEMGNRLGLRDNKVFKPLWVYDFPLLEWDDETLRFYAMHHPFTSPKPEDLEKFYSDKKEDLEQVNANAYDFVLNGTEVGGGSIRIHDSKVQERMFQVLGFSKEEADYKFGFMINAFKYGAPPHGGIAFGFDRFCSLFGGQETIRDYIAFPKNNTGRDVMLDTPSRIDDIQMKELCLESTASQEEQK